MIHKPLRLLARKANVNAATRYQITPLAIACTRIQTSTLSTLLEARAEVDVQSLGGETPFMIASPTGNAEASNNSCRIRPLIKPPIATIRQL